MPKLKVPHEEMVQKISEVIDQKLYKEEEKTDYKLKCFQKKYNNEVYKTES